MTNILHDFNGKKLKAFILLCSSMGQVGRMLRGRTSDDRCAICYEGYDPGGCPLRLLTPCYHYFHVDCVGMWLESNDTCPVCRNTVILDPIMQMSYTTLQTILHTSAVSVAPIAPEAGDPPSAPLPDVAL